MVEGQTAAFSSAAAAAFISTAALSFMTLSQLLKADSCSYAVAQRMVCSSQFDVFYRPTTRSAVYGITMFRSDQQRRARRQIKVTGEGFAEGSVSRMTDRSRNQHMRVRGREHVCEGNLGLEKYRYCQNRRQRAISTAYDRGAQPLSFVRQWPS